MFSLDGKQRIVLYFLARKKHFMYLIIKLGPKVHGQDKINGRLSITLSKSWLCGIS